VTRPMLGFKSFEAAHNTLVGIELMHMIKNGTGGRGGERRPHGGCTVSTPGRLPPIQTGATALLDLLSKFATQPSHLLPRGRGNLLGLYTVLCRPLEPQSNAGKIRLDLLLLDVVCSLDLDMRRWRYTHGQCFTDRLPDGRQDGVRLLFLGFLVSCAHVRPSWQR